MKIVEQDEFIQLLWNKCSVGYFLVDKNLTVLFANPAAGRLCSLEVSALPGKTLSELLEASIDFSIVLSHFAIAISGAKQTFTAEGIFAQGWLCLDFVLIPVESCGEPRLLIQFNDVTQKQHRMNNLERLLTLSEEMVLGIGRHGYFTHVNSACSVVLGWDPDDLLSLEWRTFIHPEDLPAAEHYIATAFTSDKCEIATLRLQAEDESWHWLKLRSIQDRINGTLLVVAHDVTADELLRQQIVISEKNYRTIFDSAMDMVIVHDAESGAILDYNLKVSEKLNCPGNYYQTNEMLLTYNENDCSLYSIVSDSGTAREKSFEAQSITMSGDRFPVWVDSYSVEYNGMPAVISILHDITEQKEYERELERLSVTDALTGLENRRSFYSVGKKEFERFRRYKTVFSLAMVDIDHFKKVNDTYGHDAGDLILKKVASTLQNSLRKLDSVFRYGGEEFLIIFPNTNSTNCALVADRIREKIAQLSITLEDGQVVHCSISVGLSASCVGDESLDNVIKRADEALYQSKDHGRNRVSIAPKRCCSKALFCGDEGICDLNYVSCNSEFA